MIRLLKTAVALDIQEDASLYVVAGGPRSTGGASASGQTETQTQTGFHRAGRNHQRPEKKRRSHSSKNSRLFRAKVIVDRGFVLPCSHLEGRRTTP